jgi:PilZ domain-containing protein
LLEGLWWFELNPVFEGDLILSHHQSLQDMGSTFKKTSRGKKLNFIEKRIFRRLKTEVKVDLAFANKTVKAATRNISCGGMFLRIDPKKINGQNEVHLAIHLPNRDQPVQLLGAVRRSESDGVAVEFEGLYNDNILAIERFVKSNLN